MTTKGPWLDDPMWTPDAQPSDEPTPRVVREHYFQVYAEVRDDGTFAFFIAEPHDLNLVYLVSKDEWVMTGESPEIEADDVRINKELARRLA